MNRDDIELLHQRALEDPRGVASQELTKVSIKVFRYLFSQILADEKIVKDSIDILEKWLEHPDQKPDFSDYTEELRDLYNHYGEDGKYCHQTAIVALRMLLERTEGLYLDQPIGRHQSTEEMYTFFLNWTRRDIVEGVSIILESNSRGKVSATTYQLRIYEILDKEEVAT